jgi:hypothetical protein
MSKVNGFLIFLKKIRLITIILQKPPNFNGLCVGFIFSA